MTRLEDPRENLIHTQTATRTQTPTLLPGLALGCAVLAVVTAVWLYWLVIPGALFGAAAVALGVHLRRRGGRTFGAAAISLGITALFLVPSMLYVTGEAEDWGRDCALDPTNPDC
jgi:hypothetical protein